MRIIVDDLSGAEIAGFLNEHLENMRSVSPPESTHALDLNDLRAADVTFWSVYDREKLVACGAIKRLDEAHAEIKSMRTDANARGRGIASYLLMHMIDTAKLQGYRKLNLETGSMAFFAPARCLYLKYGFRFCAPFADYKEDPNSVFMSLDLDV